MASHTAYLTFDTDERREFVRITDDVQRAVEESGVSEGMVLVSAMHITAAVWVNDDEPGVFAGAVTRSELAEALPHGATTFPWATFSVNVAGAFLLGYFVTRLQERLPLSAYRRPLLGTGFCGALTTFSTMQVELLRMLDA